MGEGDALRDLDRDGIILCVGLWINLSCVQDIKLKIESSLRWFLLEDKIREGKRWLEEVPHSIYKHGLCERSVLPIWLAGIGNG